MPDSTGDTRDTVSKRDLASAPRNMLRNYPEHRECGESDGK